MIANFAKSQNWKKNPFKKFLFSFSPFSLLRFLADPPVSTLLAALAEETGHNERASEQGSEAVGERPGKGVWSSLETRFRSRKWSSPHEENKEQEQEQLAATEANTTERTYDNSVFFFLCFWPLWFCLDPLRNVGRVWMSKQIRKLSCFAVC